MFFGTVNWYSSLIWRYKSESHLQAYFLCKYVSWVSLGRLFSLTVTMESVVKMSLPGRAKSNIEIKKAESWNLTSSPTRLLFNCRLVTSRDVSSGFWLELCTRYSFLWPMTPLPQTHKHQPAWQAIQPCKSLHGDKFNQLTVPSLHLSVLMSASCLLLISDFSASLNGGSWWESVLRDTRLARGMFKQIKRSTKYNILLWFYGPVKGWMSCTHNLF